MKPNFLLLLLLCGTVLFAQQPDQNEKQARDPRADQLNVVPNEVLVKFKDDVLIQGGTNLKSAGISTVDQILKTNGVASLEKLFQSETKLKRALIVKDPQGQDIKIPSLHNIYKLVLPQLKSTGSAPVNLFQFIEELKALPEVEYAEPNFIFTIGDFKPTGREMTMFEAMAQPENSELSKTATGLIPNDPLYNSQWGIPATKIDVVWNTTTGDATSVIAILDTGVDWQHPDLAANIWTNTQEIPDNGQDDDGNGLIDDIRGWDYINNDNNPTDDNSHGTHVAGNAAAVGNNGIGIAGANWNAKIMPIKVFPNNGHGDAATIVKGIYYASNNGATLINMSFGGYGRSMTLENSLTAAYAKNIILVAAAGNDSYSINDVDIFGRPMTFYPAALPYVFGIQSDGAYSNYDPDGSVYSEYTDGFNYELKAPGAALSTVPNGNYRVFQGTSMATPIVSGAISLYRSYFPEKTIEELWSNFIYSSNGFIDLNKAFLGISNYARLDLVKFDVKDTNEGCDNDGHADAEEVVDVIVQVRNTGSPASEVYVKIKQSDGGDPRDISVLKDSVYLGSIGIYRSLTNTLNPFKVKINADCYNNRTVSLDLTMCNNHEDTIFTQKLKFKIFNGEELSGILLHDTTLTSDRNWVITNSLRISQGVTVTINPGTNVEVLAGVDNRGKVLAIGTPENKISMKGAIGGNAEYKNTNIDLAGGGIGTSAKLENCWIHNGTNISAASAVNTLFENISTAMSPLKIDTISNCYFKNIYIDNSIDGIVRQSIFENVNFGFNLMYMNPNSKFSVIHKISNAYKFYYPHDPEIWYRYPAIAFKINSSNISKFYKNTFFGNDLSSYFFKVEGTEDMITLPNQYWGTNNNEKIKQKYIDFNDNAGLPYFNHNPKLEAPSDSCHAHVWKVLVNGKDAQDEVVEPVGASKQRFDVYFNRAMDKSIPPRVSFGGLYPYTSIPINEDGTWSENGRVYTVYKTIKLTTGDGINRIRIGNAKEANGWDFEIPVEDQRFEFVISAANSASLDFIATPSLGKVNLEWNNNDLADGLGFNMYRMEHVNDSVLTKPVLVNKILIIDTLYTDFSVTPNKKYYYYYKILRTNLSETDSSKVVSAIPFTASKGDANGDLAVNVLDITTIVAYLLNNNPQPFITEAADLNSDGNINVLDIVGVVNLVLGGPKSAVIATSEQVKLYLQNDTLFADAPIAIGGIQFDISGAASVEEFQKLKALEGFESGYSSSDKGLRLLYYSLSGKTIPAGNRIPMLKLKKGSGVSSAIFGDKTGSSIPVNYLATGVWNLSDNLNQAVAELGQNYPNPLSKHTTIPIRINEPVDEVVIRIVNVMGQEVDIIRIDNPTVGEHLLNWSSGVNKGFFAYLLEIRRGNQRFICPVKKMVVR